MSVLFSILIAVGALALIMYPLFKSGDKGEFAQVKQETRTAAGDREIIMSTLSEIEFDYHMNKLSEEDYHTLKNNYSGAALALMKEEEEEALRGKGKTKAKAKASGAKVDVSEIEQEIEAELAALDNKGLEKCHRCGTTLKEAGQEYCHACGERQF